LTTVIALQRLTLRPVARGDTAFAESQASIGDARWNTWP
jgi:hypothetical protein